MDTVFRKVCTACMQPKNCCYCEHIKKFDPKISFVILIHPIEGRKRIATGRMSHLCLENSFLIRGHDYSNNALVNEIIADPNRHCVTLFPGEQAVDLSEVCPIERKIVFPKNKIPTVFVLDGTWITARKMIKISENLAALPRICFTPTTPSNFRIRKQPNANCYSTIEAIHHTIELLGDTQGFAVATRQHDHLLRMFDILVEHQLKLVNEFRQSTTPSRHRRDRDKSA